jgi:Rod binding domain-containing protein
MNEAVLDLARLGGKLQTPHVPKGDARALDKAARDFEAVFVGQMLEQMWAGVSTGGTFGGGSGERIFRSLMIQSVGQQICDHGGIGLAPAIKREMIAMQERRQP